MRAHEHAQGKAEKKGWSGVNWSLATRAQLCEIAYNDEDAPLMYKIAAAEELKRRNRKIPKTRKQYREKVVYGR